ncbi:MAG: TrmH family RNA methyltransferase [Flavobacterium sp.]
MTATHYLEYLQEFITPDRKRKINEVLQKRTNFLTIALEDVYQLHNTSAVMRSCEIFGIQNLHVIEQRFGKRVDVEIAMGAQKWVDIHRYQKMQDAVDLYKKKGIQIIATTPHEDAISLEHFELTQPSAVLFGTEKYGLSDEIMQQADVKIKIPMSGFTESFNISVAASLIMYSLTNQLRSSNLPWQLSEEQILMKSIDWTQKSIRSLADVQKRYEEQYGTIPQLPHSFF